MDALVMCGGEGTRFGGETEKPLVPVGGEPMVDRVIAALDASTVGEIYAVTSPDAPATRAHIRSRVRTIEGTGAGYAADLGRALDTVDTPVLSVAADLPLLDGASIDRVLRTYREVRSSTDAATPLPSLSVVVPESYKRRLGVSSDAAFEHEGRAVVPSGINVVAEGGDRFRVLADDRFAANVNYPRDREVAEELV